MNIRSSNIIIKVFLTIICQLCFVAVFGQGLNQSLVLIRPYEPSVTDAQKITTLPNLRDTFSIKPTFQYSIQSQRIDTRFDVTPITPARLQPIPQPKLYNGHIKIGAGTLPNALAEVALNTKRNKEYAAGVLLNLSGAGGDVTLDKKKEIENYAGYSDVSAKVFGKKFLHSAVLYGDLGTSAQTVYNYGYNTNATNDFGNIIDTLFNKGDMRKRYIFADANVGIRSSHFKTDQFNYDVQLGYKFARNKLEEIYAPPKLDTDPKSDRFVRYNENAINLKSQLDNNMFGGNIKMDYFTRSNDFDSLRNNFALELNPWFMLDNDSVRMKVGMRLSVSKEGENIVQYGIYPAIEFQFTLLKDIFIPFVGIDGYLQPNTYRDMVTENPFITPGLVAPITKTQLQIYAGLKGTITSNLLYYLRVDFFNSKKEHFFVNDTTMFSEHLGKSNVQNHFTLITDDLQTIRVKAEIYYNPIESVDLGIKANFYKYDTSNELKAWHRPEFTLDFTAKYNMRNKIITNFDVMCIGKRYAKAFYDENNEFYTLNSVLAFNLGAEYRYTKSFSFFAKLNNLSGAEYERWNFFPSRRFNVMVGFTYSL